MKKTLLMLGLMLLLLSINMLAGAQVPGYMGKRFSIHYEPQFMYAFLAGHFDLHHTASIEYVTSLKHVIGMRYSYSNLKDEMETQQMIVGTQGNIGYEYIDVEMRDKVHCFTFFTKFFAKRQGYIAPAGSYNAFGVSFLHGKAVIKDNTYDGETFYSEGDEIQTTNNFALYFGRGRQFIFADKIIFNMAAHLGIPLIWHMDSSGDELHMRVAKSYVFRAQIGIGFLAF